jgi:hypothetical protein
MAEELPSLHIDTDWKKQAQEEKRKLAEQQEQQRAKPVPSAPPPPGPAGAEGAAGAGAGPAPAGGRRGAGRGQREMPPASFGTLVQSLLTQSLFYLGELSPAGAEPTINLDMAKHQIDTLTMLEEKTQNNLTDDEKRLLDTALYETRMRYVNVASQFINP